MLSKAVPVFVTVNVCGGLTEPTFTGSKVAVPGVTVACGTGIGRPVPLRTMTCCPVPLATPLLSTRVSVEGSGPVVCG